MADLINKTDSFNTGRGKLNTAIQDSETALNTANTALSNSESTQEQLDQVVIDGDSSVEAAQARVNKDGSLTYDTLKERVDAQEYFVNIKSFNAVGDKITDDTLAIQNAYDSLTSGQTLIIPEGDYLITNLVFDRDDVYVDCRGKFFQEDTATGDAIRIGDVTKSIYRNQFIGVLKVESKVRDWTRDSTGVRIINSNESDLRVAVKGFKKNIVLEGNEAGCSYNNLFIIHCLDGRRGVSFETTGTGWVNENKFYTGRFTWFSGVTDGSVEEPYHVYIPNTDMNSNRFYSPNFEGSGGTFIYCNGQYNTFYSPRLEGTSTKVHFGTGSLYNQLFYPYAHTDISQDANYVDEGSRNHIYGRNEMMLNNSEVNANTFNADGSPNTNSNLNRKAMYNGRSSSSADKIYRAETSGGVESFFVDGNGNIKGKSVEIDNGAKLNGNGIITGELSVSDSYISNSFKGVHIASSVPSSSSPQTGTLVFNTADSKLYIHLGGGSYQSVQFA